MAKSIYTLGKGWEGDLTTGEDSDGPKYADLGLYCDGELILPLGIDHYEFYLDVAGSKKEAMREAMHKMIEQLNS